MLTGLQIENVAVIEKADVHFSAGLNVLTGETGAGKSILIDSINAILGSRTSRELVRTGAEKAVIRATFENIPETVKARLEKAGYEPSDALLLMRELQASGKSVCRINGMPATAAVMREICAGLVNVHGQHDSIGLANPATHLQLLDDYAQNKACFDTYYATYRRLVTAKKEMDALAMDEAEKQRRLDLAKYQADEIDAAALTDGEEETLEARRTVLANAESIREKVAQARQILSGDDENSGAADLLGEAGNALQAAAGLDTSLAELAGRLSDAYYAAREIGSDLAGRLEEYSGEGGSLDEVEARLDTIYRLKHKYGGSVAEILAFGEKARAEMETIRFSEQRRAELDRETHALYDTARQQAQALTQTRLDAFAQLNTRITAMLEFLNMPGVRLSLQHSRGPLASHGQDTMELLISTNPGEAPKPLAKIASGGELSRIMLAIKSAMADRDHIPTVIYDEIDAGVSGKAAGRIAKTLRRNAADHQILCVTHTPQIAAAADHHLLIQKNIENERTYTKISPLDEEGRVRALASIISGDHVTEISLANAREMLAASRSE